MRWRFGDNGEGAHEQHQGIYALGSGKLLFGAAGDYLAVRADDPNDIYIIKKEFFKKTYDPKD